MSQAGQSVGNGLGLYGVKMHATALGGFCGVHANPHCSGSIFWFMVPCIETVSMIPLEIETTGMLSISVLLFHYNPYDWELRLLLSSIDIHYLYVLLILIVMCGDDIYF